MTAHKHATNMALYAKDALTTDKPWQLWEFSHDSEEWKPLFNNPGWIKDTTYRRKPQTIEIGEHEFPMPMREAPALGSEYWLAGPTRRECAFKNTWSDDFVDRLWLQRGLCHATEEAALQHAKALIAISGGQTDSSTGCKGGEA
jgi:hypothetical protein